ncbi:MAG TPA: hypothetical protein VH442_10790 [Micromonosporaceae bacterium]|jgi:hypothetical protein
MRLKPPVTVDEARAWLFDEVVGAWGEDAARRADRLIDRFAADMAAIGAVEVPPDVEPLPLSLQMTAAAVARREHPIVSGDPHASTPLR